METRKHQFNTRIGTPLGDPAMPFPTAFVMKDSGPDLGDGPVLGDGDRRRLSFPAAGLKPVADELPLAALREARLSGFAEALAVVPRHRSGSAEA